jgi:hypothetical protein
MVERQAVLEYGGQARLLTELFEILLVFDAKCEFFWTQLRATYR